MTTDYILAAFVAFLLLFLAWTHHQIGRERAQWAAERERMCNRIMAGTLQDYAALRPLVEPAMVAEDKEVESPAEPPFVAEIPVNLPGRSAFESL